MTKKINCKVFIRKNGQPVIFPGKKKLKSIDSTLKFDEELFVSLEIFKKKRGK